jgi:hypothetical protein
MNSDGKKYICPTVGLLGTKYCGGTGYVDYKYTHHGQGLQVNKTIMAIN